MSGFEELHVAAPAARVLGEWGWQSETPVVREIVPTVARGHNAVLVAPPAPSAAAPVVAAFLGRLGPEAPGLLVAPAGDLAEWGALAHALGAPLGLRVETATGPARALRRLREGALDLLVAAPATVLDLLGRAALKAERLQALLLATPERYADHPFLAPLMQDLPREAQRVLVTSDGAAAQALVERYARKALVAAPPIAGPAGPVRAATVPWGRRAAAVHDLVTLLDPATVTIWAHDRSQAAAVARQVTVDGSAVRFVTDEVPPAALVVALDVPDAATLGRLVAAGDTVVLVPPGAEGYLARIATAVRPLRLPGALDELALAGQAERQAVLQELERDEVAAAVLALAPLFERHDAVRVAAACYNLWKRAAAAPAPAAGAREAAPSPMGAHAAATAKVFLSVGKKDGVTPADIVGALTRELRVDRSAIGRIELRDGFSLVELPAAEAEAIAQRLSGVTIRRVKVSARLDRGPGPRGAAPRRPRERA